MEAPKREAPTIDPRASIRSGTVPSPTQALMLPRFRSRELGLFTEIKLQFDKLVRPSFSGLDVQGRAKEWTPGCENVTGMLRQEW